MQKTDAMTVLNTIITELSLDSVTKNPKPVFDRMVKELSRVRDFFQGETEVPSPEPVRRKRNA